MWAQMARARKMRLWVLVLALFLDFGLLQSDAQYSVTCVVFSNVAKGTQATGYTQSSNTAA